MNRPTIVRTLLGIGAFLLVLIPLSVYFALHIGAVGQIDAYHWGLTDFRDAGYYPVVSVRDGVNPYHVESHLAHSAGKVGDCFPLYSPLTILLYFPLSFLSFETAGVVFTAVNLGLMLVCIALSLKWCDRRVTLATVFTTGSFVLASQPAQSNMNFGQFTWGLVLGSYLGLAYAKKFPILAGFGLALASVKPTYAVAFGFLMLWRGDFRALANGVAISILGAIAGLLLMAGCGVDVLHMAHVVVSNQTQAMANPQTHPSFTSVRVDLPVFIAKALGIADEHWSLLIAPVLLMLVSGWLVWRDTNLRTENTSPASVTTMLICLSALLGIYRIVYDVVLMALPLIALFVSDHPSWKRVPKWGTVTLQTLSLMIAYNFLWTGIGVRFGNLVRSVLPAPLLPSADVAWFLVTLVNPTLITVMWTLVAMFVYRQSLQVVLDEPEITGDGTHN